TCLGRELLDRACLVGRSVLNRLRLIEYDQRPGHLCQPVLPPRQAVGCDDQVVFGQSSLRIRANSVNFFWVGFGAVDEEDPERWGETYQFLPPVAQKRRRHNQEAGRLRSCASL